MDYLQTISKLTLAGLVVWRLTQTFHAAFEVRCDESGVPGDGQPSRLGPLQPEGGLGYRVGYTVGYRSGYRVMDLLFWIVVGMSAQTALWVACGFSGVLLNWLALSGAARVWRWSKELPGTAAAYVPSSSPNAPARDGRNEVSERRNGASELCL